MTQTDSYTPESTNTPISHNGKGDLYDALDAMDVAPEVQDQIDATESISERILGINIRDLFFKFDPALRVKIMDMRKNPEDYKNHEAEPLLERVANDNINPETKKAA